MQSGDAFCSFSLLIGRPDIFLPNETYYVDTLQDLIVEGTIRSYPNPNVQVFREVGEEFEIISSETNSRFSFVFDMERSIMTLTITDVEKSDGGRYMVHAWNRLGGTNETFLVMPRGK